MTTLLRGLASRKLTIVWLCLFSAFYLFAVGGEQTRLSFLRSVGLNTNEPLRSLPMLVLFGLFLLHLLLKPLAAWMGRSKKHVTEEESEEAPLFQEPKSPSEKRRESLYTSISIAEVKTLIPYRNLRAFLRFFRIELPEDNEKGEVIFASYGRSRTLFLSMTLLGLFCLGASLLSRYSVFPPASMVVFSQPNQTQMTHPAPLKGWIHKKFSLWNTEPIDWGVPTKIRLTFAQKQEQLLRSSATQAMNRQTRIETRWRLLQEKKNLQEKRSEWLALNTQRIGLSFSTEETQKSLRLRESKRIGTLFWTFMKQHNQLLMSVNSKDYALTQGIPQKIGEYRFVFQGIGLKDRKPAAWLFAIKDDKKQTILLPLEPTDHLFSIGSLRWLPSRQIALADQQTLRFFGIDFGAELRYQPVYDVYLGWFGIALFFLGFLGAWWKTRYHLEILWGGDKGFVRIEGSGIKEQGRSITQTIQDALLFPIDWVAGPTLSKQSSAGPPSGPTSSSLEARSLPLNLAVAKKAQQSEVDSTKKVSSPISSNPQTLQSPPIPPPLFANEEKEVNATTSTSFSSKSLSTETASSKKTAIEPFLSTTTSSSKPPQTQPIPLSSIHPASSFKPTAPSPKPSTMSSTPPAPPKESLEKPRIKTDEFAAPTNAPLSPAEQNFTEATAVSHRPELLQQVRQTPQREGATPSTTPSEPNTSFLLENPKPTPPSAFSPLPPASPSHHPLKKVSIWMLFLVTS